MKDRYGFKFQVYIHTFRNTFQAIAPTGLELANILLLRFNQGSLPMIPYGVQQVSISQMRLVNNEFHILFHLYDPSIQDPDYVNHANGSIRFAARGAGEDPARSAHMVINIDAFYDATRTYPAGFENVEYVSRSLISKFLNDLLWQVAHRQELKVLPSGKEELKDFSPRVQIQAHASQSLESMLTDGGKLLGIKVATTTLHQTAFGDAAYPVVEEEDISIKVQNEPTGNSAKQILIRAWGSIRARNPKRVTVVIQDDAEDRLKSVSVDVGRGNILENIFVRQFNLGRFNPPLRLCEPAFRNDLIQAIRVKLL